MKLLIRIITTSIITLCLIGLLTFKWLSYNDGQVHVVNTLPKKISVKIIFPSGEERNARLEQGASKNFYIPSTGKGSIQTFVDGNEKRCSSYVTTMNKLIILSVTEEQVFFSQHFRQ